MVPGRHGPATTRSPRGEVDQQDFSPAELRQRYWLAVRDAGQDKIRMRPAHTRRIAGSAGRRHGTNATGSKCQKVQVSHGSGPQRGFMILDLRFTIELIVPQLPLKSKYELPPTKPPRLSRNNSPPGRDSILFVIPAPAFAGVNLSPRKRGAGIQSAATFLDPYWKDRPLDAIS